MNKLNETFKVVLVGESGVGKTSILSQYLKKGFSNDIPSTLCALYSSTTINIDDNEIKLEIWDTAGQEKYRTLTKIFYNDTSVAILVYDITNQKSFNEIKKYWSKEIKENSPTNFVIMLVANKSDLYENEKVDESEARQFAKEIGAGFKRTSAENANGIESLFFDIGRSVIAHELVSSSQPNIAKNIRRESIKIDPPKQKETKNQKDNNEDGTGVKKKCC